MLWIIYFLKKITCNTYQLDDYHLRIGIFKVWNLDCNENFVGVENVGYHEPAGYAPYRFRKPSPVSSHSSSQFKVERKHLPGNVAAQV